VSAELFSRYDEVLLSSLLDTMENMLYCPRPACQYPVVVEPGEEMARCPSCTYVFCIYCRMVYHGIEPCRFRSCEYSCHKYMMSIVLYLFFQFSSHCFSSVSYAATFQAE
jgi:E3 ubiquitin-protein ligase RNF14